MDSQEYWKKRNEAMFLNGEKDILKFTNQLKETYEQSIRKVEDEINIFYGKYATENELSMTEVKKLLSKDELSSFKSYTKEMLSYSKDANMETEYINQLRMLYLKSRVSRLEELKARMQFQIEKLNNQITQDVKDKLMEIYEDGYYETLYNRDKLFGISGSFTQLNTSAVEKAVKTEYMTQNYSDALWKNKNSLLTILNQKIPQGIALGYNPKKVAALASKSLNSNYNATVRLVRTEYNLILNDGAAKGYKEAGLDKYQILATLDDRTSDICQSLDLEIFNLSEKEVGITYPPFHPNCRTTTIPYFEPDEFDKEQMRIARDNKGKTYMVPANLSYKEWKEGLVEDSEGTIRYESSKIPTYTSDVQTWVNMLTESELVALQNYSWKEYDNNTVADYKDVNNYLRNSAVSKVGEPLITNTIENIDNALNKFKLDKAITVYRGIDTATLIEQVIGEKKYTRDVNAINNYLKGNILDNKAYTSTSTSRKEAMNFGMGSGKAIMKINVPAGTNGAYLDTISKISREKEFLLARDTQFKITNVKLDNALERFVVYCDLI